MRRVLPFVVVAVALAGCSSGHRAARDTTTTTTVFKGDVPQPRNEQDWAVKTCAGEVPNATPIGQPQSHSYRYVNAQATTVGEIHAITGGPPRNDGPPYVYTWILPNLPDREWAAWCWAETSPHNFKLFVVGPRGETVDSGQGSHGGGPPGPGPLQVP